MFICKKHSVPYRSRQDLIVSWAVVCFIIICIQGSWGPVLFCCCFVLFFKLQCTKIFLTVVHRGLFLGVVKVFLMHTLSLQLIQPCHLLNTQRTILWRSNHNYTVFVRYILKPLHYWLYKI